MSPEETAAAVREMLAAAAVPLDLERAQLLEHSLVLKQALQDARATLSAEQQGPLDPDTLFWRSPAGMHAA